MNAVGATLTVLFCLAILVLPRRYAPLAYIGAALYITQGQFLVIGGLNLPAIRFVELAAATRVVVRRELASVNLMPPDRWLLLFFAVYMGATLLRAGTIDTYTIGQVIDGLLVFYGFRALISTAEDFTFFMKGVAFLIIPFVLAMVAEAVTGRNLFALMDGVPEVPVYRDGHFRCQGSFRHAITAGSVGATFFPIFVGFIFQKAHRRWALIGTAACLTIVVASHSSGPLMSLFIAVAAWCCWSLRRRMKWVRRGIVALFVGLHLMMKAPVWFIFDRISGVIGGDGWHRSNLIDKFIKSIDEWWIVGMSMEHTEDWAATVTQFGTVDITNYYVSIGINGGLFSLVMFIAMLTACFKLVGSGLQALRRVSTEEEAFEPILWGVGSAIFAHAANLTAVSYWDQSYVIWYLHLAVAVSLGEYCSKGRTVKIGMKQRSKALLPQVI